MPPGYVCIVSIGSASFHPLPLFNPVNVGFGSASAVARRHLRGSSLIPGSRPRFFSNNALLAIIWSCADTCMHKQRSTHVVRLGWVAQPTYMRRVSSTFRIGTVKGHPPFLSEARGRQGGTRVSDMRGDSVRTPNAADRQTDDRITYLLPEELDVSYPQGINLLESLR